MPSAIDEQTQYVDTSGAPLVGGKIFIGTVNADAKLNPISIFSDRALAVSLSNPQTLDADGRSTNKIWIPGRYSLKIENVSGSQVYQELDNGEEVSGGITSLSNVSGGDTITATASTTITAYVDKEIYVFKTAQINTGAVTLNVDGVGAKAFVKNFNKPILPGDFAANQIVAGAFNSTSDNFDWVNQKATSVTFYEGAAIASAATTNIWATDGDTIHITGEVACTSFGTAPNVGARKTLIYDSSVDLTGSANLNLPRGVNYTTQVGDRLNVYADTVTQHDIEIIPSDRISGLRGFLAGLTLSNDTDTDHINITSGEARDSTNVNNIVLASEITKQIDATWSVGDDAGGLDTGTVAEDTYFIHLILRSDTGVVDALFSLSETSPTLPTDYDKFVPIGAVVTDSSFNILQFIHQVGTDRFDLSIPVSDYNVTNPGTSATLRALTAPKSTRTTVIHTVSKRSTSLVTFGLITSPAQADTVPTITVNTFTQTGNIEEDANVVVQIVLNSSGQIRTRLSASDANLVLRGTTHGWFFKRGGV